MEKFFFIVTHINITEVMQLLNTYITLFPMLTVFWMYTAIVNMENYTYFLVDASILISNFTMRLIYPVAVHLIDFNHVPSLPPTENENVMEGEDHFFEYVGNFFYAIFIYWIYLHAFMMNFYYIPAGCVVLWWAHGDTIWFLLQLAISPDIWVDFLQQSWCYFCIYHLYFILYYQNYIAELPIEQSLAIYLPRFQELTNFVGIETLEQYSLAVNSVHIIVMFVLTTGSLLLFHLY